VSETRMANDPTVGFPPLPGGGDTAPPPLTDDEQQFIAGKITPATGALGTVDADFPGGKRPAPSGGGAVPAGDLGLPPPGVVEMYKPGDVFDTMNRYRRAAVALPEAAQLAEPWQKLWEDRSAGIGLYSDGNRYFVPLGPKDPAVIRQQAAAGAGGVAAGGAPFAGPRQITVSRPDGTTEIQQMIQNPDGSYRTVPLAPAGPGPAGGASAGAGALTPAGTPVGGFQVEPAVGVVQKLAEANEGAARQLTTLSEIRELMNRVDTGPLAEHIADLGAKLKAIGVDSGTVDRVLGPVDSAEALRKAFWNLGTAQVTTNLGGHPAGFVVQEGLGANPNIHLQPGANELMTNLLGMQARRTQDQYTAASDAMSKPPPAGYGAGGVYGAVNDAVRAVSGRYQPEAMLGAAKMMTKAPNVGGWAPDMYDSQTGAPTPKGQAALDVVPSGAVFYSAAGKPLRKNADGTISQVK
jgi:hypothetical protein